MHNKIKRITERNRNRELSSSPESDGRGWSVVGKIYENGKLCSICLSVSASLKTNDPKVFKLGTRNDLGIS